MDGFKKKEYKIAQYTIIKLEHSKVTINTIEHEQFDLFNAVHCCLHLWGKGPVNCLTSFLLELWLITDFVETIFCYLQQSAENSGSSTSSSGSNYGTLGRGQTGMASMMDEMAKTLARRRAAAERKDPCDGNAQVSTIPFTFQS